MVNDPRTRKERQKHLQAKSVKRLPSSLMLPGHLWSRGKVIPGGLGPARMLLLSVVLARRFCESLRSLYLGGTWWTHQNPTTRQTHQLSHVLYMNCILGLWFMCSPVVQQHVTSCLFGFPTKMVSRKRLPLLQRSLGNSASLIINPSTCSAFANSP